MRVVGGADVDHIYIRRVDQLAPIRFHTLIAPLSGERLRFRGHRPDGELGREPRLEPFERMTLDRDRAFGSVLAAAAPTRDRCVSSVFAPSQGDESAVRLRGNLAIEFHAIGQGVRGEGDGTGVPASLDQYRNHAAAADGERVVVSPEAKVERPVIVHDSKAQRVEAIDDTLLLAYLIEPSRPEYPLEELEAEYGLELEPDPAADEETTRLVRNAAATFRLRDLLLERVRERDMEPLYRDVELPLSPVLAAMEAAGVKIDEYRMGEITARLREMVEELESRAYELAGEEFMLGSTQQVGHVLFERLGLTPGRKGKTGYSTDTRVLRSIRSEHEMKWYLESRFPGQKMVILNMAWHSRVVAFDSGPVELGVKARLTYP